MTTLKNGIVIDETTWNSPNYSPGRPYGVTGVTIHWWGLPAWKQSFNQVANHLSTPRGESSTSAHFVISDDRVACLVSPDDRAWHALAGNLATTGLELDPNGGADTIENACQVIAMLEDYYDKSLDIYPHNYWTNTQCPGHYADKIAEIVLRVNEIRSQKSAPEKPMTARNDLKPHWVVGAGDTLTKIARHYFGKAGREELSKLASHNGIVDLDGLKIGQKVYIPGPLVWTVDPGDTWEKIASYYGYSVELLKELNPGKELTIGTIIKIL